MAAGGRCLQFQTGDAAIDHFFCSRGEAAVRLVDGKRQLALLRWGLIPSWAKDTKIGASGINARADTVATKPMFRTAYKRRWLKVGNLGRFFLR